MDIIADPFYHEYITKYLENDCLSWVMFHMVTKELWNKKDLGIYYEFRTQNVMSGYSKHSKKLLNNFGYDMCIRRAIIDSNNSQWLQYFLEYHRNKFTGPQYSSCIIYCDKTRTQLRNQLMDFDMNINDKAKNYYNKQYWIKKLETDIELFTKNLKCEVMRLEKLRDKKYTLPYSRYLCNLVFGTYIRSDHSSLPEEEIFIKLKNF
jgi:hypothetical protein